MEPKIKNQNRNHLIELRLFELLTRKMEIITDLSAEGDLVLMKLWINDVKNYFNVLNNRHYMIHGERFQNYSTLKFWYKHMEPF